MVRGETKLGPRLFKLATQSGGLKALTDDELAVWLSWCEREMVQSDGPPKAPKARRLWRDRRDEAQAEQGRRESATSQASGRTWGAHRFCFPWWLLHKAGSVRAG